ncbi:MAG TPA: DUF6448 family protein [bacterium]
MIPRGAFCAAISAILLMGAFDTVFAHCDTMNGPPIPEAMQDFEKGDVTPVLKWVKSEYEAEVRAAFTQAVLVRTKGPEAKALADRYFLETVVRLHRAGEGAPYTGIKDTPPEKIVVLADEALAKGYVEELVQKMQSHLAAAMQEKFIKAMQAGQEKDKIVEAGREFVEAYVLYMHYIEGVHAAIMSAPDHRVGEEEQAENTGHGH